MNSVPTAHGYSAPKPKLLTRLARIGADAGVARMVADDRYRIDVLTQVSAIQAALGKVSLGLLDGRNLREQPLRRSTN